MISPNTTHPTTVNITRNLIPVTEELKLQIKELLNNQPSIKSDRRLTT